MIITWAILYNTDKFAGIKTIVRPPSAEGRLMWCIYSSATCPRPVYELNNEIRITFFLMTVENVERNAYEIIVTAVTRVLQDRTTEQ